jgi:integrase
MRKGSIRKRGKRNSWEITIDSGINAEGTRKRQTETVRGSKSDAQKRLNVLLVEHEKGNYTTPGRLTLADLLSEWMAGYVKTNCSQRTYDGYQSIIDHHLTPALGHLLLKQLRPQAVQQYYGEACESLSALTVHHHHRVLSQALRYAVRQEYLGRNPAELVDPPSPRKKAMRTMTPAEVETLLDVAKGNAYYPVAYTALSSGLRQAELLGLRWRDIDLDMSSISVSQVLFKRRGICTFKEPKTEHSRRRVNMTPKLAVYLRGYQAERQGLFLVLGRPLTLDDLVFSIVDGHPLDPSVLSHAFGKIAARAGLKGVRFHDLRHTFASLMLLRGAKPKVISEALGHSSVAFTMDTYSHIIEGMQEEAMALLDEVLPAGVVQTIPSSNPSSIIKKLGSQGCSSVR